MSRWGRSPEIRTWWAFTFRSCVAISKRVLLSITKVHFFSVSLVWISLVFILSNPRRIGSHFGMISFFQFASWFCRAFDFWECLRIHSLWPRWLSFYNRLVGAPLSMDEHPSAPELNRENLCLCIENFSLSVLSTLLENVWKLRYLIILSYMTNDFFSILSMYYSTLKIWRSKNFFVSLS